MIVNLDSELERLINQKVKSGRYTSAEEVIREALALLDEQDELDETQLEELRRQIAVGIEQADRGQTVPFDPEGLKARVRRRMDRWPSPQMRRPAGPSRRSSDVEPIDGK